ncbi:SEC-C domain-containing protein [Acinetobacter baumannii]|uniref:YecA family protein n=1 Tax=Acinetobacter TaxID=469 RepID=UPI0009AAE170|nr:SEC-C metal-binding domain-containing protein [Acinetobacter baumannii]MCI3942663.1 SEC-C domain-containing protein [Acinetobacter baumannii]
MKKQGRNDLCECKSGKKYKKCCLMYEIKDRLPLSNQLNLSDEGKKFYETIMNQFSQIDELLRIFCKENGFYYFRGMSINDHLQILEKFNNDNLTKDDFFKVYREKTSLEYVNRILLSLYCDHIESFKKRKKQLESTCNAYFSGQYDLAIISSFVLIEGILRDIGELNPKDKIKPTVPRIGHEEEGRYHHQDGIGYFNAFITKLFEGAVDVSEFNRNTILHGFNIDSFNQHNSLILLLTLLEIGDYMFNKENYIKSISGNFNFAPYMINNGSLS